MDKKIVIPEGMKKAIYWTAGDDRDSILRAALRWLSENPIVPTLEQVNEIMPLPTMREIIAEWQRRMFLAPVPNPIVLRAKRAVEGTTLTREEADEIIAAVNQNVPPGE